MAGGTTTCGCDRPEVERLEQPLVYVDAPAPEATAYCRCDHELVRTVSTPPGLHRPPAAPQ